MISKQPIRDMAKIEEIKDILRRSSYRNYFLFLMGINTGLRISDLLELKVKDVRGKTHIVIKEEKTEKEKRFPLFSLTEDINEYVKGMKDNDYLFPSREGKGKPFTRHQAWDILRKAGRAAGIEDMACHTLRKTFGYHHYKKFKDVVLLQEIFNHSAPSITLRYIGINQDVIDASLRNFKL